MSLNFGRPQVSIPGPSIIPDRVLNAMHRPSPNIYEGALVDMVDTLFPDLKTVAKTNHQVAIYIANGHGAWEAALKNTLKAGDKVLILGTGKFPITWGEMARSHGIETQILEFGMQNDADPNALTDALKQDVNNEIKAVLAVQTDTASSVKNDIAALRRAIDDAKHDALFMVDCIAKASQARKRVQPGEYWDWVLRTESDMFYRKFDGTSPTHHLYALREALDILVHEETIEAAWKRHTTFANCVWAAIDHWGEGGDLKLNISDKSKRSTAVTTLSTARDDATKIRQWCEEKAGLTLGIALGFEGDAYNSHLRIGHMGHLNPPMVLGALATIETAMKALKIPHGEGALSAASDILTNHE